MTIKSAILEQTVELGRPSESIVTTYSAQTSPLPHQQPSAAEVIRVAHMQRQEEAQLKAFTRGTGPSTTWPLMLASVTIAVLSMSMDAVQRYSHDAFLVGIVLTIGFAVFIGKLLDFVKRPVLRTLASIFLPTAFGAVIGMVVQAIVLRDVGGSWAAAVKDLGGLVDTTEPISWVLSGIVLGGLPALLVALFLLLASRSIKKLVGHDASEAFGVGFTGIAGVFAVIGSLITTDIAVPPLFAVTVGAAITLLIALLVDGSRIRFLRKVYAGNGEGYDIVPASRFANDPSLAPMVANAGAQSVLVHVETKLGSYRNAAGRPIALVAENESETLRPLLRRRALATTLLVGMMILGGLAMFIHVS